MSKKVNSLHQWHIEGQLSRLSGENRLRIRAGLGGWELGAGSWSNIRFAVARRLPLDGARGRQPSEGFRPIVNARLKPSRYEQLESALGACQSPRLAKQPG